MINGIFIRAKDQYPTANNDYVANGGDDCSMLRPFPQVNKGYIFRDAILDHMTQLTREDKPVTQKLITG